MRSAESSQEPCWPLLVERIRSGDADAVEQLYRIFSTVVRFQFLRQLGPDSADDLTQDLFVTVVVAIRNGQLREPERLMGFVRTIVRRQVAAQIDDNVKARRSQVDLEAAAGTISARDASPEQRVTDQETKELAVRTLNSLRKRDRDILARFYLDEQPAERIQREMALSETQFRLIKSRALAAFGERGKAYFERRHVAPSIRGHKEDSTCPKRSLSSFAHQ